MANLLDPLFPTLIVIVYHFVFVVFLGAGGGGGGEGRREKSLAAGHHTLELGGQCCLSILHLYRTGNRMYSNSFLNSCMHGSSDLYI